MLTGDHPETAKAIAIEVGILPSRMERVARDVAAAIVMTAMQFDALLDNEVDKLPVLPLVIARCAPSTKVRMIEALHRRKRFCAMTGDGVNDSPSLRRADVGIAMGLSGSDVAKDASDIVLTDDNFASIVAAIEEDRRIFDNIQKFVLHVLAENIAQAGTLLVGLVFKDRHGLSVFPLAPVEIVWIIDVLVNNTGFAYIGAIEESEDAEVKAQFDINIFAILRIIRATLPHFRSRKSRIIMNLSSVGGFLGFLSNGIYCATKFAIEGLTESLAAEVAPFGIHCVIVEPGYFRTAFLANPASGGNVALAMAAYEGTSVHEVRKAFETINGKQPGDPVAGAARMWEYVAGEGYFVGKKKLLRLPLGSDCGGALKGHIEGLTEVLGHYEDNSPYLNATFQPISEQLSTLLAKKEITYDLLWALFEPNAEVYTTCPGTGAPRCVVLNHCEERKKMDGSRYMYLESRYLNTDGKVLGEVTTGLEIPHFRGTKQIEHLQAYPLQYHPEKDRVRRDLIRYGCTFVSLIGIHHRHYKGKAFFIDIENDDEIVARYIKGRIMVDKICFQERMPNYPRG
ncbi:uncharacterized protein DNG_09262 [Cephalotrichum gorgonifer]|uniref:DUF7025 domain-containing protein n=1 Tax=Cephalotrichum gorgonifer TaxID=2041049 RepID=A0AAE8SZZ2_9PEZI|nr:uncharacterized protein DNG_09262 [Cephalotrichum gorgonifer]